MYWSHTKIDYLICDIDLSNKKKTGFSVLSEAKQKYPNCKVLMHTNRNEPEDIRKARKLGACGFCPKPITEAILVDLLLDKKLWPSDFKEKNSSEPKREANEYINAIPNTNILIVNDDSLALKLNLTMMESLTKPKNNVQFYTATGYKQAKNIIEEIMPDILISDYNLETKETGIDVCKYFKGKNEKSISVLYSGMTQNELKELKEKNPKWVDEVFSTSCDVKNILETTFNALKSKNVVVPKKPNEILRKLVSYTFSMLFEKLDKITLQVENAPELLDNLEKFKEEFANVIDKMSHIEHTLNVVMGHLENNIKIPAEFIDDLRKLKQLLNIDMDQAIKEGILKEYLQILHSINHDIVGNIIIVKNFLFNADKFSERMGADVKSFARENIVRLQGLNEARTKIEAMLVNCKIVPNAKKISSAIKDINKKTMDKISSASNHK